MIAGVRMPQTKWSALGSMRSYRLPSDFDVAAVTASRIAAEPNAIAGAGADAGSGEESTTTVERREGEWQRREKTGLALAGCCGHGVEEGARVVRCEKVGAVASVGLAVVDASGIVDVAEGGVAVAVAVAAAVAAAAAAAAAHAVVELRPPLGVVQGGTAGKVRSVAPSGRGGSVLVRLLVGLVQEAARWTSQRRSLDL
jgi:hypothetical protein